MGSSSKPGGRIQPSAKFLFHVACGNATFSIEVIIEKSVAAFLAIASVTNRWPR